MKNFMFAIMALVMFTSMAFAGSAVISEGGTADLATGFSRCVADSDCDAGDVCILANCYTPLECKADAECGENEVCYRGICIAPVCIVSAECPTDFLCDQGRCVPKECVGDSYCGPGKECVNYECVDAPSPMELEPEPEPEPEPPVELAPNKQVCPVCDCKFNCQPCEKTVCPKLECPECGPFDGELEIPILLFGLVVVAAIGFFAGKMGGNNSTEDVRVGNEESGSESGGEVDINDEASFRYI